MAFTRREFLKGMGISIGGVGLTSAGYDRLIPYINQPEDITPGVSTWYATTCRECPAGCGMVLRNRESHVVKCEGNPLHPINRGTLCSRGQATIQRLYDPDRFRQPQKRESGKLADSSWDEALGAVGGSLSGRRVALITDLQTGSLAALMRKWLAALGSDRLVTYEPISYSNIRAANSGSVPSFDIASSDYLIAFASDFLETWLSPVEFARAFAKMRKVVKGSRGKFVYVGPRVSMTATNADVRLLVPPGACEEVAAALLQGGAALDNLADRYGLETGELRSVSDTLKKTRSPLAMPGWDTDSARAAELVNSALGSTLVNTGRPHAVTQISSQAETDALVSDMDAGAIDALLVYAANPAYSLPDSKRFTEALKRVPTVVSLSSSLDETAALSDWILPSSTPMESWGDYAPYPDVTGLMQPAMGLMFDTRQTGDILIGLAQSAGVDLGYSDFYSFLRAHWAMDTDDNAWEKLVQAGGRWSQPTSTTTAHSAAALAGEQPQPATEPKPNEIALWTHPHIYYYDGRSANLRWLQETPEPVTKGVWGSWVEMHPKTAERFGVHTDDLVEVSAGSAEIMLPAYVHPGIARDTAAIALGEGHKQYGRFASNVGVNVYPLLNGHSTFVTVRSTGDFQWVTGIKGSTDESHRKIVQLTHLSKTPARSRPIQLPLKRGYTKDDFYPGHPHRLHRWAMVVDLDKCIGCHACVTACYAENNLATVGPEGIYRKREMSWLRIDRYIDWSRKSAPVTFQPMMCQHCDAAPCEPVCPVFAAAHSDEGLNMQIYNRCVGTRYCSNNCPYKVRRFNFYDYTWPEPLNLQLNPEVTVRCRGVMEKCTFCIQRIREAEIVAKRDGRRIEDGEITPACAQTCPTGVLTFGDLRDPDSRVSRAFATDPRAYQVLGELNTKTAVVYLKRVVDDGLPQ